VGDERWFFHGEDEWAAIAERLRLTRTARLSARWFGMDFCTGLTRSAPSDELFGHGESSAATAIGVPAP